MVLNVKIGVYTTKLDSFCGYSRQYNFKLFFWSSWSTQAALFFIYCHGIIIFKSIFVDWVHYTSKITIKYPYILWLIIYYEKCFTFYWKNNCSTTFCRWTYSMFRKKKVEIKSKETTFIIKKELKKRRIIKCFL